MIEAAQSLYLGYSKEYIGVRRKNVTALNDHILHVVVKTVPAVGQKFCYKTGATH